MGIDPELRISRDTFDYVDGYLLYAAVFAPNGVDPNGTWSIWGGIDWGWLLEKIANFLKAGLPSWKVDLKIQDSGKSCCCKDELLTTQRIVLGIKVKVPTWGLEITGGTETQSCGPIDKGCVTDSCAFLQGTVDVLGALSNIPGIGVGFKLAQSFDLISVKCGCKGEYCLQAGLKNPSCGCTIRVGGLSASFGIN
jgi:hypothetical protein